MRTSISIRDVSFHYVPDQPVLRNISLTIEPGTTAIIGQNGAGKTTLMKLLNGLLKPTSGEVWVDDLNTSNFETHNVAKRVGLVFQNPNDQIFKSKVLDEVMFGPINIGMPVEEARTSALRALQEVELADAADENPYDLSYAFRKRICIASILAMQTDVVVFDEPTISQDSAGLDLMRRIIKDLSDAGKTVIAIVHDMNFAAENFERVIAMAQGQVVADGTPQQLFTASEVLELAHVDAPSMIKLSQSFDMEPLVNVAEFVHHFQQKIGLSKH